MVATFFFNHSVYLKLSFFLIIKNKIKYFNCLQPRLLLGYNIKLIKVFFKLLILSLFSPSGLSSLMVKNKYNRLNAWDKKI